MEKQFVTYPIARLLKELGFNEPCIAYYGKQDTMMGALYFTVYNGNAVESEHSIAKPNEIHLDVYAPLWQQVYQWIYVNHNLVYYFKYDSKLKTYDLPKMEKDILSALRYIKEQEALREAGLI